MAQKLPEKKIPSTQANASKRFGSTDPAESRVGLVFHTRGGKESKHVLNEVFLVGSEGIPVIEVLREIHFFSSPERGLGFLVHLPNLRVLDWERRGSFEATQGIIIFFVREKKKD
nr:hypothetical protein TorRG33x02_089040 [Ipomoea trifida]